MFSVFSGAGPYREDGIAVLPIACAPNPASFNAYITQPFSLERRRLFLFSFSFLFFDCAFQFKTCWETEGNLDVFSPDWLDNFDTYIFMGSCSLDTHFIHHILFF